MSLVTWARTRSPWLIHFNGIGCNGCDIEVVAVLTPRYDIERFESRAPLFFQSIREVYPLTTTQTHKKSLRRSLAIS